MSSTKRTDESIERDLHPWLPFVRTLIQEAEQGLRLFTDQTESISTTGALELMHQPAKGFKIAGKEPALEQIDPDREFLKEKVHDLDHVGIVDEGAPKRPFPGRGF
jgi:hypothetical protein